MTAPTSCPLFALLYPGGDPGGYHPNSCSSMTIASKPLDANTHHAHVPMELLLLLVARGLGNMVLSLLRLR